MSDEVASDGSPLENLKYLQKYWHMPEKVVAAQKRVTFASDLCATYTSPMGAKELENTGMHR